MEFSRLEYWSGLQFSFSRGSSQPRDCTWGPCVAGRFFTTEPPGKPSYTTESVTGSTFWSGRISLYRRAALCWCPLYVLIGKWIQEWAFGSPVISWILSFVIYSDVRILSSWDTPVIGKLSLEEESACTRREGRKGRAWLTSTVPRALSPPLPPLCLRDTRDPGKNNRSHPSSGFLQSKQVLARPASRW